MSKAIPIQAFTDGLREAICKQGEPFIVHVRGQWSNIDKQIRWFLTYSGGFSRDDLNELDRVAKNAGCYYEVDQNGAHFSLDLPYATNYKAMQERRIDDQQT